MDEDARARKHYSLQCHRSYTWVGNRISECDMAQLYRLKQTKRKPITCLVAEAVREFLDRQDGKEVKNDGIK